MPCNHKRTAGSRHYQDYSVDTLNQAVGNVHEKRFSAISQRTVGNNLKGKPKGSVGRTIILTSNEELVFKEHVIAISDFGFLFDTYDLRMIFNMYLDRKGVTAKPFKNNIP